MYPPWSVWTKYGKSILYENRETDLITKTWGKLKSVDHEMKSKSGHTCVVNMHPPRSMCGTNMVNLGGMAMEKMTNMKTRQKFKSVDHEIEVRWNMPG
jgi:hypothetical protein